MKKIILFLLAIGIVFVASVSWAASPWLVCDPQTNVDYYIIDTDGVVIGGVAYQNGWVQNNKLFFTDPGGTRTPVHVLMDETSLTVGSHTQKAKACKAANPPWSAEVCSNDYSIPLTFTKPAPVVAPNAPTGSRLVGQ